MGKKGGRRNGVNKNDDQFSSSNDIRKSKKFGVPVIKDSKKPDSRDPDFYYDEVDEFHQAKEKISLDGLRAASPVSSDEEVYKVRVDTDDDDEEEEEEESEQESTNQNEEGAELDDDDMKSDLEDADDESYLPSADAWGKRKKAFYNTDYVDKDYGAYYSESDEEAAELEEQEAIALQKRLADHVTEEDFMLNLPDVQEAISFKHSAEHSRNVDTSQLTDSQKFENFVNKNPEFLGLIEEYKAKKQIIDHQLKPVVKHMQKSDMPETDALKLIHMRYDAYCNYLLNLHFYFLLKATHTPTNNHPIIGRIVEWKKIVDEIDEKSQNLNEDLQKLAEIFKLPSYQKELKRLRFVNKSVNNEKMMTSSAAAKKKSIKSTFDHVMESEVDEEEDEFYNFETGNDVIDEQDQSAKRAATYEILKNRGTTPKRKKENRNPRVKHRRRFDKAMHKKRSQVPDVKKEWRKYGGEDRGIKPNVIKSVKLR